MKLHANIFVQKYFNFHQWIAISQPLFMPLVHHPYIDLESKPYELESCDVLFEYLEYYHLWICKAKFALMTGWNVAGFGIHINDYSWDMIDWHFYKVLVPSAPFNSFIWISNSFKMGYHPG